MASLLRLPIVSPAVTAFDTFALIGFYAALIPNLLAEALRLTSSVISGLVLAGLFAVATGTVAATASLGARTSMLGGLALLIPALALLVATEFLRSMPLLVFAAAPAPSAIGAASKW
jgi:ABC-type amino acid transport system permease subunit